MKKLLIFSFAIITVVAAISMIGCKKKPGKKNCYLCSRYELIYAPIFIQYNQPRKLIAVDTLCDRSEEWIQQYMDTHKPLDTIKHGTHEDTIILNQHSSICEIQ